MKKEDIKELIEFFNEMDMNRIKVKSGDFEVELEKFADCCELPKPVVQAPAPTPNTQKPFFRLEFFELVFVGRGAPEW